MLLITNPSLKSKTWSEMYQEICYNNEQSLVVVEQQRFLFACFKIYGHNTGTVTSNTWNMISSQENRTVSRVQTR